MGGLEGLVRLLGSQEVHDTSQTINKTTNPAFRLQSTVILDFGARNSRPLQIPEAITLNSRKLH